MADQAIGNAYLNVKPKVDSNFGKELEAKGGGTGKGFGTAFSVAAGNLISQGLTQVAQFAGQAFSDAFQNAANFEQLAGGVEKIFDSANQAQIFADAQNAYKELNISANQYLEAINQVGAAFSATMGDQKGYDVARQGMLAISDYASGTGRSIDELNQKYALITRSTSSYQSIADQFSGILPATSSGFLESAQAAGFLSDEYTKLTEVPIEEYQQAVTAMISQGVADLGLAGNTALETETTISGSIAALQAVWTNFLTGLFQDGADLETSTSTLLTSLQTTIGTVSNAIFTFVSNIVGALGKFIYDQLKAMGIDVDGALAAAQGVVDRVLPAIQGVAENVMNAINAVVEFVWPHIADIVNAAISFIGTLSETVFPAVQGIVEFVFNGIKGVAETVWPVVSGIVGTAMDAITGAIDSINGTVEFVAGIFDGIQKAMEDPIGAASEFISKTIDDILGFFNFEWSLPDLKLPHINVGSYIDVPVLGRIPDPTTLTVDWYAQGGFVNGATLIGAGEAGAEMILPQNGTLMDTFADAVASRGDSMLIAWLDRNLGRTIAEYTPTLTRREFDRMARGAIA